MSGRPGPAERTGPSARRLAAKRVALVSLAAACTLGLAVLPAACGRGNGPADAPDDWVAGAAAVRPSVHSVWGTRPALDGTRRAFAPVGTGFTLVVDSAGALVLTNAHVVADTVGWAPYPRLAVLVRTDTGGILYGAELAALDSLRDLALLRIRDTTLVPVRWASERIPMGTPVATIGFGLPEGGIVDTADAQVVTRFTVTPRLTTGYSSTYRTLRAGDPASNVLEVDLPIFPGVSGGPTFLRDGRVVGVNRGTWRLGGASAIGHVLPPLVVHQFLATMADSALAARVPPPPD